MSAQAGHATKAQFYDITTPTGVVHSPPANRAWTYSKPRFEELLADNLIYWPRGGNGKPRLKKFPTDDDGLVPMTVWLVDQVDGNPDGKRESIALFGEASVFDTPKPERLLERIIHIATSPGDLVMDFFGGSGTTAAVAHKMGRRWLTVELSQANADTFIIPRLTHVVTGQDEGGVTYRSERVAVEELPEGLTADEARQFNTYLTRVLKEEDGLDEATIRALRASTKTRECRTRRWDSGGGFTVAKMGPSMYEVDDESGEVFLSSAATNGTWSKAVAGQLKFTLTPDDPVFCGKRNRQRLAVIDGVADATVVRTVVEHLAEREKAVIVAKSVLPEAAELLQRLSTGSRIKKAPGDMFPNGTVK